VSEHAHRAVGKAVDLFQAEAVVVDAAEHGAAAFGAEVER